MGAKSEDKAAHQIHKIYLEQKSNEARGLVSILNLGERNFFLPNKGKLIGNFFEILLSKYQKLGGAMAPFAPPLTRALDMYIF